MVWVQRTTSLSDSLPVCDQVGAALDRALRDGAPTGASTGCIVLQFDDSLRLCDRLGRARQSEILAASIRSISHVRDCLLAGADVGTMPPDIFKKLISHPLTDKGLAAFVADAKKANVVIK